MLKSRYIILSILLLLTMHFSFAQNEFVLNNSSQIYIHGTSTIHDWTSEVKDINGKTKIEFDENLKSISSLEFKVKVESIKSGKSKMDELTYEALKNEKNPYVYFQLNNIQKISGNKITANGNVTIAGVKKAIQVNGTIIKENKDLIIFGTKKINMKDFGIEPPTAMFGTIVVGEEVEVEFNLVLKQQ
jgi:polyisoprenoid-binding protein YceI